MNKQQQRSEETRNRILSAAASSFAHAGYDGSAVSEICRQAGVSKGAFYHHFASKQAVFLELLNRWLAGMENQLQAFSNPTAATPEKLLSMTAIFGHILAVPREELLIYLEFLNRAARDPQVWEATTEPYNRYRNLLSDMIEKGIEEGSLQSSDPNTVSAVIVSFALGLLIQGYLDPQEADWEEVSQDGLEIILNGLRK